MSGIYSKLTINTPGRSHGPISLVFMNNFELAAQIFITEKRWKTTRK